MYKILSVLLIILVQGCAKPESNPNVNFDLEEILNEQAAKLSAVNAKIQKQIIIGDQEESRLFQPDSLAWTEHLGLLYDFSPAKPAYVGAFEKRETKNSETYILKANQKAPLKTLSISWTDSSRSFTGKILDDKGVYTDFKEMSMEFRNDQLVSFAIKGYQKMMLKDTVSYTIRAEVLIP